jgi:RNA 2',3'-cyclic 3'-phosphodiesterase
MSEIAAQRLFLALPVPDDVREKLRRLQLELRPMLPAHAVRWTKPEQFHLTLKFLGNVPATDIGALSQAVRAVCDTAPPMRLRAEGAGFFPDARSPRVFWMDIKNMDGRLMEFQRQLELAVQSFAAKQDAKKFTAHVTLARFEQMRSAETETLRKAGAMGKTFGDWIAEEVQLIRSSLQPAGPLHAILDSFKIH